MSARDREGDVFEPTLSSFASWCASFSYLSPITGIFALFFSCYDKAKSWVILVWMVVAAGQTAVALVFSERARRFPKAGSTFVWTHHTSAGVSWTWWTGWIGLCGAIITITAVGNIFPGAVLAIAGIKVEDAPAFVKSALGIAAVLSFVLLNVSSVRLTARLNDCAVVAELAATVGFALVLVCIPRPLVPTSPALSQGSAPMSLQALFDCSIIGFFVLYGFDTASTLGEETKDAERSTPRAVLASTVVGVVGGALLLIGLCRGARLTGASDPLEIVSRMFGAGFGRLFAAAASLAILGCGLSVTASASRLCLAMARMRMLPASEAIDWISAGRKTPVWCIWVVGGMATIPLLWFAISGVLANAAAGLVLSSYLMCLFCLLTDKRDTKVRERTRRVALGASSFLGLGLLLLYQRSELRNPGLTEKGWAKDVPICWAVAGVVIAVGLYLRRRIMDR